MSRTLAAVPDLPDAPPREWSGLMTFRGRAVRYGRWADTGEILPCHEVRQAYIDVLLAKHPRRRNLAWLLAAERLRGMAETAAWQVRVVSARWLADDPRRGFGDDECTEERMWRHRTLLRRLPWMAPDVPGLPSTELMIYTDGVPMIYGGR